VADGWDARKLCIRRERIGIAGVDISMDLNFPKEYHQSPNHGYGHNGRPRVSDGEL
jgi:hypothetical protein